MPCLPTPLQKWPPSDLLRRGHDWPARYPLKKAPRAAEQVHFFPRERSEAATLTRQPWGERRWMVNYEMRTGNCRSLRSEDTRPIQIAPRDHPL